MIKSLDKNSWILDMNHVFKSKFSGGGYFGLYVSTTINNNDIDNKKAFISLIERLYEIYGDELLINDFINNNLSLIGKFKSINEITKYMSARNRIDGACNLCIIEEKERQNIINEWKAEKLKNDILKEVNGLRKNNKGFLI